MNLHHHRPGSTPDQRARQRRLDADTRRGRSRWPFPNDTPADRARTIANQLLRDLAQLDPDAAEQLRGQAHALGETWLGAAPQLTDGGWLTRQDVADLAGVDPRTVSWWTNRGTRAGFLTRHPEGYSEREVHDYLTALRDAPHAPQEDTPDGS